jgi:hypothetical protein
MTAPEKQTYTVGAVDADAIIAAVEADEPLPTYEQAFPPREHVGLEPPPFGEVWKAA